jgi:hypothetical protein
LLARILGEDNPKDGSEEKVTTQVTKATEQQKKDARRQSSKSNDLDNRYGKIGISAVAAACRHQGEQQTVSEYRIPYDRD